MKFAMYLIEYLFKLICIFAAPLFLIVELNG